MPPTLTPQYLDAFTAMAWTWLAAFLPRVIAAVALLVVGAFVARWASGLTRKVAEETGRVDSTLQPIIASSVRYGILIVVAIAALSQLGVQTTSVLAVLGAAGLAIGLALQGTLSNIAAGIMLVWLRPFQVGDAIEVVSGNPLAGTVREMGLFACLIEGFDGTLVFAPNSTIWNFALKNHNAEGRRLVCFTLALRETADIELARATLQGMMANDGRVSKAPPPDLFVDHTDHGDFALTCRLWTAPTYAVAVEKSLLAQARRKLAADIVAPPSEPAPPSAVNGPTRRQET